MGSHFPASCHQSGWGRRYLGWSYFKSTSHWSPVARQGRGTARLSVSSMLSNFPTLPVEHPMASTEPVTPRQSAVPSEEQPQEPVLPPSESAVSSLSPVAAVAAPTTPTPSSPPTPPARTVTPAPTPSAPPT